MKKKKHDLFDDVMMHGKISIGTMGMVGITGKMYERMPSSGSHTASNIMGGMSTMSILPTIHGVGVVFKNLKKLDFKGGMK